MSAGLRVDCIDHVVLNCRDVDATVAWYVRVLGMSAQTYQDGRIALTFGQQRINVRPSGTRDWATATVDAPGSLDLCFIADVDPREVRDHLDSMGVSIVEGPVRRHGARGEMTSHYCFDPDGNAVEIASYL